MTTLSERDVEAIRQMLIQHVEADNRRSPRRRLTRNVVAAAGLVAVGIGGGFGIAVASGANVTASTPGPAPSPLSYYLSEIPALERPQQPTDALPPIPGFAQSTFLDGSIRRIGERSSIEYFLGLGQNKSICLLIYPTAEPGKWLVGCSTGLPFGVADEGFGSARVSGPQGSLPPGSTRLDQNVVVDPTSNDLADVEGG